MFKTQNFAIVDLETTGPISDQSHIIDIGIVRIEKGKLVKTYESLVRPPVPVPPSITRLTGIQDEDLVSAPTFKEIIGELEPFFKDAIFGAHNAPFDFGFLNLEYLRLGKKFEKPILCTKNLAHKALPDLPKLGLDALMEHFDIQADVRHRALPDAEITAQILLKLFKIENIERLIKDVLIPIEKNPIKVPGTVLSADLSSGPGIYRFFDERDRPIYIGAACNIASRVLIHFLAQIESKKEAELCRKTKRIESASFASELEAKIEEAKQIRRLRPKYNRILRNWYPGAFLWVSREEFPRIFIEDEPCRNGQYDCFGPYGSRRLLEKLLDHVRAYFHLCDFRVGYQRRPRRFPGRKSCSGVRPKRCLGACLGKVKPKQYQKQVKDAVGFLTTPLRDAFMKDKTFLKILNDKKGIETIGGWKARKILKRLLKEGSQLPDMQKNSLIVEEVRPNGPRIIYLVDNGFLRKVWTADEHLDEGIMKDEINKALQEKRKEAVGQDDMLEKLVIRNYLKSPKAYRRIIKIKP